MSSSAKNIFVCLPGVGEFRGGIQMYGASLLRGLRQQCGDASLRIFLKNNHTPPSEKIVGSASTYVFGFVPNSLRTLFFSLRVLFAFLVQKPDLLILGHVRFLRLALFLNRFRPLPFWVALYGFEAWNLSESQIAGLKEASRILVISDYTRERVQQCSAELAQTMALLPCVVSTESFASTRSTEDFRKTYGLSQQTKILLTVSRLEGRERRKGHRLVFKALERIRMHVPGIHYFVVGEGHDREKLEAEANAKKLPVTFPGFVSDADLPTFYAAADVFVMPSDMEGFGIAFIEALAAGTAVIGAKESGARDIVQDPRLGRLIDADDVSGLVEALEDILETEEASFAELRHAAVRSRFDEIHFFENLKRLLEEDLANP